MRYNIILVLLFLSVIIIPALAHTVTMNFAYNMSNTKDNTLHFNDSEYNASLSNKIFMSNLGKKYIASSHNKSIFAVINAGSLLEAGFNTTFSSASYILQLTEAGEKNRFIIGFTNGTASDVNSALDSAERFKILAKTIGKFAYSFVPSNIFIRIEFDNADIFSRIKFSGFANLEIRNSGISDSLSNITLGVRI